MKPKYQKNLKNYAVFSGIAVQMVVTIWLGNKLGLWLDAKYPNEGEWYTKGITMLAVFLSIYSVISRVNKLNKK
jgi:F0F1-type ATP synthase assembly protein I